MMTMTFNDAIFSDDAEDDEDYDDDDEHKPMAYRAAGGSWHPSSSSPRGHWGTPSHLISIMTIADYDEGVMILPKVMTRLDLIALMG